MIFNDSFKFTVNPVEGVDIHKEFEVGGQKYTIAKLREMFPLQEDRYSCVVDWDDMCQYTAVGLSEALNEIYNLNTEFNLVDFLSRTNYPNGIDYVKRMLYPNIPESTINEIYRKNYAKICQVSPKTEFFNRMFLAKLVYKSMTFIFPYEIPGLGAFVGDIEREIFTNKVSCDYIVLSNDEQKKEFYKKGTHDIYVVANGGICYEGLLLKNREDKLIITPDNHHGINDIILVMYLMVFEQNDLPGPNMISIQLLAELNEHFEPYEKDDKEILYFNENIPQGENLK